MRRVNILLILLVLFVAPIGISSATPAEDAIDKELSFRPATSFSHPKIDSRLLGTDSLPNLTVVLEVGGHAEKYVDELKEVGAHVENLRGDILQVSVPAGSLGELAQLDFVRYIRPPRKPVPVEISQGVNTIQANLAHVANLLGQSVNVAVIDTGFDINNTEINSNIVEWRSFRRDGDIRTRDPRHGTAIAEIIVDVAPQARLFLYNIGTEVEFLNAIDYVGTRGIRIVSISLAFFNEGPYDGTGRMSEAIDALRQKGVLPVVAAGNEADSHWEGQFSDPDGDGWHNFSGTVETNSISLITGEQLELSLSWNDWPQSNQNYDLYLLDENNRVVASSTNLQRGFAPPTEELIFRSIFGGTFHVSIFNQSATRAVRFELFSSHRLSNFVSDSSIPNVADARGALTVGATFWRNDFLEAFSSRGPTNDGRIKPDVVAPDGVSTSSFAPSAFFGTSAAAPHVAGLAALIVGANPQFSADDIQKLLENGAIDRGSSGKDNDYGSGSVRASLVSIDSSPRISPIVVDGVLYDTSRLPVVAVWSSGSTHVLSIPSSTIPRGSDARHLFARWVEDASRSIASSSISLAYSGGPKFVVGEFSTQFLLTVNSSYSAPGGSGWYDSGSLASISLSETIINHGNLTRHVFSGWVGSIASEEPAVLLRMDSPKTIFASWRTQYFVTVKSSYGAPLGEGWYDKDADATVSVEQIVNQGNMTRLVFEGWSGDASAAEPLLRLGVDSPKVLEAKWKKQYEVSLRFTDNSGQESISPVEIIIQAKNGTSLRIRSYDAVWLDDENYAVQKILWMNADVRSVESEEIAVNGPQTFELKTRVYNVEVGVMDILNLPLSGAKVTVRLSNGTEVSGFTDERGLARFELVPLEAFSATIVFGGQSIEASGNALEGPLEARIFLSLPVVFLMGGLAALITLLVYALRRK